MTLDEIRAGMSPGPWRAVAGLNRWNVTTTAKPRTFNICAVNTERVEQEANAALIAMAPAMLDAVDALRRCVGADGCDALALALEDAERALAKLGVAP